MIRVGSLFDMAATDAKARDSRSNMTPKEQLEKIYEAVAPLYKERDKTYAEIKKQLHPYGVCGLDFKELETSEKKYVKKYFKEQILPILSPQIVDANHPFPHLRNKEISVIADLKLNNKNMLGILSMKDIAKDQFAFNYSYVDATYDNICEVIKGREILRFDDDIVGELLVASYKSTTFMEEVNLTKNNILIVGNRHSIIEYAVNSGVKLIVIIGNGQIKEEHLKIAKKNKVNIISTSYNTLETTKIFSLCNNVSSILNNVKILCVNENDDVNDFIKLANKTRYSYYPVLNKNGRCNGIIRFSDVGFRGKKNVILVDHNSYEQSAIGLEDANILEIIDHHNIGTIGTNMPISFRNMPVGSTNTIIYKLYKENRVTIPKAMAGLMLSGILSDTLILTSPTTTDIDKEAVAELSKIAKVNYKVYGNEMIKAGSSLKGMTKEQILYKDYKNYTIDNYKVGLGQIITTDIDEVLNEKEDYIKLLNTVSESNNYLFVCLFVTNVLENGTYVLFSDRAKETLESAFGIKDIKQGEFLKGIVSRKKQILPVLINDIE